MGVKLESFFTTFQERRIAGNIEATVAEKILKELTELYKDGIPKRLLDFVSEQRCRHGVYTYRKPLVLLPLHKKWAQLILEGRKTRECRLSVPKVGGPFTALIYETLADKGSGKVIGQFDVPAIDAYPYILDIEIPMPAYDGDPTCIAVGDGYDVTGADLNNLCLTIEEFMNYGKKRDLYGWYVENPIRYDEPKGLSDYYKPGTPYEIIKKPPQSYMEVYEL